ncbi:hypothetical protein [Jeotgalibacillus soli]|uniref:Uncharacterized protein n=1 Tax=Jeotgalibacillus soli TaxID=889306 RepID=A0A0C2RKB8_9BACL|nr:hypothetical protein [Jeotgalibacillus soli]KIL50640.1 hypothetical protein KP78_06410 [Jeotgalibacillus soli]
MLITSCLLRVTETAVNFDNQLFPAKNGRNSEKMKHTLKAKRQN